MPKHRNVLLRTSMALLFLLASLSSLSSESQLLHKNNLNKLLAPFTEIQHIKLAYHEKRYSLFLKQARQFNGYIEFTRPDRFVKQIENPDKKKYVLQAEQLTIYSDLPDSNNKNKKVVSLEDYPQFKQFQALFSGLLSGNAETLSQYYQHEITSLPDKKILLILKSHVSDPFIQKQANISHRIDIIFVEQAIKTIIMHGFGGEKSELRIESVLEKDVLKIK